MNYSIIFVMNKILQLKDMNLLDFPNRFPDEAACKLHLRKQRESKGIVCEQCGGIHHYWIESIEKWQCAGCKKRLNLKSGTIMYKSKLSVLTWYKCMHMMMAGKLTFSALEMQRQLKEKSHSAVWYMMHKIRIVMGARDAEYQLKGDIELDEGYFRMVPLTAVKDRLGNKSYVDKFGEKHEQKLKTKQGHGSPYHRPVSVIVESKAVKQEKPHKKKRVMGFVKMIALDIVNAREVSNTVAKHINYESILITDNSSAYKELSEVVWEHHPATVTGKNGEDPTTRLPWVHTIISNAKAKFADIYKSINDKYLQNYLDEFVYKLNRRNFTHRDPFDGLLKVAIAGCWN